MGVLSVWIVNVTAAKLSEVEERLQGEIEKMKNDFKREAHLYEPEYGTDMGGSRQVSRIAVPPETPISRKPVPNLWTMTG